MTGGIANSCVARASALAFLAVSPSASAPKSMGARSWRRSVARKTHEACFDPYTSVRADQEHAAHRGTGAQASQNDRSENRFAPSHALAGMTAEARSFARKVVRKGHTCTIRGYSLRLFALVSKFG
jgi:hypothetical protein